MVDAAHRRFMRKDILEKMNHRHHHASKIFASVTLAALLLVGAACGSFGGGDEPSVPERPANNTLPDAATPDVAKIVEDAVANMPAVTCCAWKASSLDGLA